MALFQVLKTQARAVRRKQGSTVTFVNQSTTTDVYFDRQEERLNRAAPGGTPDGTKLSKNGGQLQYPDFPGVLWFRSTDDTTIEVVP